MQKATRNKTGKKSKGYPFAYIALWQMAVFLLLICLIWVNNVLKLPALYFDIRPENADFFSGLLLTIGVLITAVVMIGNTYVQQRKIVHGLIITCSYCNKVKIERDEWERFQNYLSRQGHVAFSYGVCPECYPKVMEEMDKKG